MVRARQEFDHAVSSSCSSWRARQFGEASAALGEFRLLLEFSYFISSILSMFVPLALRRLRNFKLKHGRR